MDYGAPIDREGTIFLFDDNSKQIIWNDEKTFLENKYCNKEEYNIFRLRKGYITKGDKVKIVKGRKMVGEVKTIERFFDYEIPGTYGHKVIRYVVFTDGTKCNKNNLEIILPSGIKRFNGDTHLYQYNGTFIKGGRI